MKDIYIKAILMTLTCLFLSSCIEKKHEFSVVFEHTVIVYMLANNDLYQDALANLNEMEAVWDDSYNGKIIAIIEPKSSSNDVYIIEIERDSDIENITSPTIRFYQNHNAINPNNLSESIIEIANEYPSNKYSLILWSHATGWLPPNTILAYSKQSSILTKNKSFGESDNLQMDIIELARSIPSNMFDLIIFDACYMGSIEVLYEMKNKAKYIVASPTEILSKGFPYTSIINIMFSNEKNVPSSIGKSFVDYYKSLEEDYRSAAIGVIETAQLQALAEQTFNVITNTVNHKLIIDNIDKIQSYDRFKNHIFFDFKDVILTLNENEFYLESFKEQFKKTVIYSDNTEWFLNEFELKSCSGLSCYIPREQTSLNTYYQNLNWFKDSGINLLFDSLLN